MLGSFVGPCAAPFFFRCCRGSCHSSSPLLWVGAGAGCWRDAAAAAVAAADAGRATAVVGGAATGASAGRCATGTSPFERETHALPLDDFGFEFC